MLARLNRLRDKLEEEDYEAILITKEESRYYLSGFSGTMAYLLITPKQAYLLTDFRYLEQAKEEASNYKVVRIKKKSLHTIKELTEKLNLGSLAFEAEDLSYQQYKKYEKNLSLKLIPSNNLVDDLRWIKDDSEVKKLKSAVEITDKAFEKIISEIKLGMSEKELALKLEFQQKELGAEANAFDFIVASGPRSSLPHGVASDKSIARNELLTLDFGAVKDGYHSDMTRTIFTGEKANSKQKELYSIVLKAQQEALSSIKAGKKTSEIDKLARDIIADAGYGEYFGHSLGHGVGLEIHEAPRLSQHSDTVLKEGMVVSVEPGIYLSGEFGVRIEDLVVVKKDGIINLTDSTKEFICLGL